jgi:hypothetical protein
MTFRKAADGITKKGKTKGKNLGDSGPTIGIESGAKGKGKAKSVTSASMKAVGRNMARANNQRGR